MTNDEPWTAKLLTIGVIGGSSHVATEAYYKIINKTVQEEVGGNATAEVVIASMNYAKSIHFVYNGLWDEGASYVRDKALALKAAGADFVMCVSNTWHRMAPQWMNGVGLPLLHIVDTTSDAIKEQGLRKVALLGTKPTMAERFVTADYNAREVEIVVPTADEQDYIDRVIIDELCNFDFRDESRRGFLEIIDRLAREGAEGVILGCTEITLLIEQSQRPDFPIFPTLDLHARAAAIRAVRGLPPTLVY